VKGFISITRVLLCIALYDKLVFLCDMVNLRGYNLKFTWDSFRRRLRSEFGLVHESRSIYTL
jgi:hypothetical protein